MQHDVFDAGGNYLGTVDDASSCGCHQTLGDAQPTNPIQQMNAGACAASEILYVDDLGQVYCIAQSDMEGQAGAAAAGLYRPGIDTTGLPQAIQQTASNIGTSIGQTVSSIEEGISSGLKSATSTLTDIAKWVAIAAAIYFAFQAFAAQKRHE